MTSVLVALAAIGPYILLPDPPSPELGAKVARIAPSLLAPDARQRGRAEQELLNLGPRATEPLIELMKTASTPERDAIRALLPRFGPAALESLYWAPFRNPFHAEEAKKESRAAVARMGPQVLPYLKPIVDADNSGAEDFLGGVLAQMKPVPVEYLSSLLPHPSAHARSVAARLLAGLPTDGTSPALLDSLNSVDATVRRLAAQALGERKDVRALGPLLSLLKDDSWPVRAQAAGALAKMYQRQLLTPLVGLARGDEQILVRDTTSDALILWTKDPVAIRLGRRYRPISVDPIAGMLLAAATAFVLLATGLAMYVATWIGVCRAGSQKSGGIASTVLLAIGVLAAFGVFWGGVVTGISGPIEYVLLWAVVPAFAWMGYWAPGLKILRVPAWGGGAILVSIVVVSFAGYSGIVRWLNVMWLAPRLIAGVAILTLVLAWWWGRGTDPSTRTNVRLATALGVTAFYAGYGTGWAALWGYLGV
jgi:hypothetical protein